MSKPELEAEKSQLNECAIADSEPGQQNSTSLPMIEEETLNSDSEAVDEIASSSEDSR